MADSYVVIDGTRYTIECVEDRDTLDVVAGVAYGWMVLSVSCPLEEEG